MSRSQRGQVVPFVVIFMFFVLSMITVIIWLGTAAGLRAKAQATADAAALAGAVDGEVAAKNEAATNHGVLTRYEKIGNDVRVIVQLGKVSATARATDNKVINDKSLAPALRAAIGRAESIAGKKVVIVKSSETDVEVSPGTAPWLGDLSDSTGLCVVGTTKFVICASS